MDVDRIPLTFADRIETVTLGMGCFWSPEALFGHLPGVVRTRVGYAGGTSPNPTYREMGDHTETVEIGFDPARLRLETIVRLFRNSHTPANINGYKGRQYHSLLLYRDERQRETMEKALVSWREERGELAAGTEGETELAPLRAFYVAEDRHQKYYLKRYRDAVGKLRGLYPRDPGGGLDSTLAARLNGIAKGYANLRAVREEIESWPASPEQKREIVRAIEAIRW